MVRPTISAMILDSDIESGIVKEVIFKDLLEYWIYAGNAAKAITIKGVLIEGKKTDKTGLQKIVVCENKPDRIVTRHLHHIAVKGIIYSDMDTPDMTEYLTITGRTA